LRSPASFQPDVQYREVVGGYVGELAWSPDGSKLAISTYTIDRLSHSVLITDPGDGYAPRLLDGCHVTWSPDSAYLAVHRDPGAEPGAWVVSATDAAERWAITREVQAFPLTWLEG
jgi:Tol biopolymer transport system component